MEDQKIQSLIEELQHLTRTMQRTSGSENNNADLIRALGLLSARLSGKTRTADMETKAVEEFANKIKKVSDAVSKEAAAVKDNTAATQLNTKAKEKSLSSEVYELNEKKRAYRQDIDTIKSHGAGILQLRNKSQALQFGFQALSATVKGVSGFMTGYAQALLNGERGAQVTAKNIEALSKPMLGLVGQVGSLAVQVGLGARGLNRIPGVSNLVNKALGKFAGNLATKSMIIGGAIAVTTAEVAKFGVELVKQGAVQIDRLFDSFQKLSEVGIRGANGIEDVEDLMEELGMQTAHVEKFNNLLIQNSREIGMLGGTMMDGARTFTKLTGKMFGSEFGAKLMKLGMTQDQVNEAAIRSMAIQARSSSFLKKSDDERAASTAKFVIELDKAAQLTGASRKEQAEALAAALQEKKFAAAMRAAERSGDTQKVKQLKIAQSMAAQAKVFGDIRGFTGILEQAAGGNTSEDAIAAENTYNVQEAMRLGLDESAILPHMARGVELQQQQLDAQVAMTGDIKILQTDSVKSNDLLLRSNALLKGAADAGFTGPDAIRNFMESQKPKEPVPPKPGEPAAPPSKLDAMVDAARMQQQAALIMDKALGQISNTATIHSLATKQFSEAVNMFAKVGGIDAAKRDQISTERGKKEAEEVAIKQAAFEKMKLDPRYQEARTKAENVAKIQVFKSSEEDIENMAQIFLKKMPKYADGGIAKGPGSGHLAMLHGTEAVIPLAGGNIPVSISGGKSAGQTESPAGIQVDMSSQIDMLSKLGITEKSAGKGEVGSGPAFSKVTELSALMEKVVEGIEKSNLYLKDILDEITGGATVGGAAGTAGGGAVTAQEALAEHDHAHPHDAAAPNPELAAQIGKIVNPLEKMNQTSGMMRNDGKTYHGGIDLAGKIGDKVMAPISGIARVLSEKESGGYGNMVEVTDATTGIKHMLAHLDKSMVKSGDVIKAGQQIGTLGNTGKSTGAHLHHEVRDKAGNKIDPSSLYSRGPGDTFGSTAGGAAQGNPQAARRGRNMGATQMPGAAGTPGAPTDMATYMKTVAMLESGGDPNAKAGTSNGNYSSAGGLFQFLESSYEGVTGRKGSGAERFDPAKATEAMQKLTMMNKGQMEKGLGREVSGEDLYMGHFLGAGGATKFLQAKDKDPNQSAAKFDPTAAASNKSIYYDQKDNNRERSMSEVHNLMTEKYRKQQAAIQSGQKLPDVVAALGTGGMPLAGAAAPTAVPPTKTTAVAGAAPPVTGFAPGAQTQPAQQPVTIAGMAQNILGSIFGGGTTAPSGMAGPTLPGPSTDMSAITQALQAQTTATQSAITSSMENMTNRLVESLGTAGGGGAGVAGAEVPGLLGDIVSAQREQTAAINRLISVQTA